MTDSAATDPAATEPAPEKGGFLAPSPDREPVDHCVRCGKETPAGVGLCEEHNPKHIRGPSATQMHATVFGGIVIGVIVFFILLSFAVGRDGPFEAEITSSTADASGGIALAFVVANQGEEKGEAECRVTRDGVPRPDDLSIRTDSVPAGESITVERITPQPPAGSVAYVPETVSVICK